MAKVVLPPTLLGRIDGSPPLAVDGATVGEVLDGLQRRYPGLRGWILDEQGRVREHVNLFVNSVRAPLEEPVGADDELFVIQAISGGTGDAELLVGTRKGLFVLRGARGRPLEVAARAFTGQTVDYACHDPRSGRYLAAVTHGQFGPHLYYADDPTGEWTEADGPAFPADTEAAVKSIWVVEPGEGDGVLWAGVAPAALFRSEDGGASWTLVRALWDHPTRPEWEGGMGGLCLHSICPWPGEPDRLAVGISAAGVWLTEDGGASWQRGVDGLVANYQPEGANRGEQTLSHCIHKMCRSPIRPERLFLQYHGGVYRSDDGGASWNDIAAGGLPSNFGFPLVVDPNDPDRAFVLPLVADVDRVTPAGRVRVYETRDAGAGWRPLTNGLPQDDAYLTVLRQAFCHDGGDPLGLYFGSESGEVFGSVDGGATWHQSADRLPPVTSVRAGAP